MAYKTSQISLDGVGSASRLGSKIINCKGVSYYWDTQCLLDKFTYNFQRYDKLGIVGRNGVGKSTFLDLLTGELEASEGFIDRGESLVVGYYRQEGMSFDESQTVLETVADTRLLNRFLFSHDMFNNRISRLSGGEKRRLYLLTILMKNPNLLILDEPTNDLDIITLNILEEYLKDFGGSLIIVSHDRHFLDRVVDHLFVFSGEGKIKDFVGKFSEYRSYIKDIEAEQKKEKAAIAAASKPKPAVNTQPADKPKKLSYKEKREMEMIESTLPELEIEKEELEAALSSGTLDYTALQKASERIEEIIAKIDELETRWLELNP